MHCHAAFGQFGKIVTNQTKRKTKKTKNLNKKLAKMCCIKSEGKNWKKQKSLLSPVHSMYPGCLQVITALPMSWKTGVQWRPLAAQGALCGDVSEEKGAGGGVMDPKSLCSKNTGFTETGTS